MPVGLYPGRELRKQLKDRKTVVDTIVVNSTFPPHVLEDIAQKDSWQLTLGRFEPEEEYSYDVLFARRYLKEWINAIDLGGEEVVKILKARLNLEKNPNFSGSIDSRRFKKGLLTRREIEGYLMKLIRLKSPYSYLIDLRRDLGYISADILCFATHIRKLISN